MTRIGLALSGGGFRATLYHLGVIRYLRDSGGLADVADIASVSGGSVLAAHLVLNWSRYTGSDADFAEAAAEVIRFVQFDVRNRIVRRLPLLFPLRLAAKLTGWHASGLTPNALLERYYREFLYGDRRLFELPEAPCLHILATNVSDGVMAVFSREGLHVQKRESGELEPFRHVAGQTASVAKAVAASSAFPGFFPPVEITAADLGVHEGQFPPESFTDGGVYDNLGTRAFAWLSRERGRQYERVIVSDAGKPFQVLGNAPLGFIAQSIRASDILWDRVWQLERENFGDRNGFFFAPVTRVIDPHEDPQALHPVVQAEVSSIRTDLDRFSDLEVNALVQHGYEVVRGLHRQFAGRTGHRVHEGPAWEPRPGHHSLAAVRGPAPIGSGHGTARTVATSAAARVAKQLRRSSQRKVWSTLLDFKDWPSWVYLALGLLVFVYFPVRFYQVHRHAALLTSVVDSISKSDPDIRLVLDIIESDPLAGWALVPIAEADAPTAIDYSGLEILSRSRIVDMRPGFSGPAGGDMGRLHIRERMTLRIKEGVKPPADVVFRSVLPVADVEYRQPKNRFPLTARRVAAHDTTSASPTRYEVHCDLSLAPVDEPVTLELGMSLRFTTLAEGRMPLINEFPCDLLTVWMVFPEDHPYRRYQLVRYPLADPAAVEPMKTRYEIDHPYGQLIGWSVITPEPDTAYECRWTSD